MRTLSNSELSIRMRHAQHKVAHSREFLPMLSGSIVDQLDMLAQEATMMMGMHLMMNCYVGVL